MIEFRVGPPLMSIEMPTHPTAFVSYSWDDDVHKDWVKVLATRLRSDTVDVRLDQWHSVPGNQLTHFMKSEIGRNDFVIIVCTPKFKVKSDGRTGGVGYEGDIMTAEVFTKQNHLKFIPVLATRPQAPPLGPLPSGYRSTASTSQVQESSAEQATNFYQYAIGRFSTVVQEEQLDITELGFLDIVLVLDGTSDRKWYNDDRFISALIAAYPNPSLSASYIWKVYRGTRQILLKPSTQRLRNRCPKTINR
jgi:hypothetical protein